MGDTSRGCFGGVVGVPPGILRGFSEDALGDVSGW